MNGPTDLAAAGWSAGTDQLIAGFLGGSRGKMPAVYKAASPITYVRPGLPAVLTLHGTTDSIVPYEQAERLHAALARAGVAARLESVSDKGHFWDWSREDWQFSDAMARDFADRHLKRWTLAAGQGP
jgi:dipeptidyl aminopeptidase/acylaminoacyl peptidase